MAFDFPASPVEDQVFSPPGGPVYVYKAPAWRSSMQATQYGEMSRRNRVVNGAMQISQENGNTAGTASVYYAADQWMHFFGSTGTFTVQRVQSVTPNGSQNRYRVTVTVADAALGAGDYLQILHPVEGVRTADFRWGAAQAKQVVLRFGFKGPAGTYSAVISNGAAANRSYFVQFTISAGQANTDTEQTFVIPGDTTGTWTTDTTNSLTLRIVLAAGSPTFIGTANVWQAGLLYTTVSNTNGMATAGNVFELFDVGLYLDAQNTGVAPRWEMPDEAQELLVCQRYWRPSPYMTGTWHPTTLTSYQGYAVLTPPMRVTPAIAILNAGGLAETWVAYRNITGVPSSASNTNAMDINLATAAASLGRAFGNGMVGTLSLNARM